MKLKKTLHFASHLKWVFLIAAIVLIFYSFIAMPENIISIIGIVLFLMGIYLGLESMRDADKMTIKEKSFYSSKNNVKRQVFIILSAVGALAIISLLFMALKFIFPTEKKFLFNEFFNLGLDCWAFILGLLCLLKSTLDKHNSMIQE